jgi:16S rRNA (cytosine1402-N4)-methyltransferase
MVDEVLAALRPQAGHLVADCTLGFGGHAEQLLSRIGPSGRLLGLDIDEMTIGATQTRLAALGFGELVAVRRSNFAGLAKFIGEPLWSGERAAAEGFDLVFADLGVSSMQIDNPQRGFSYKHDGPLDMRMDQRIRRTAADWLAKISEAELAETLRELGDEPAAEAIAARIHWRRERAPLRTTRDLVRCVEEAVGGRGSGGRSRGASTDVDAAEGGKRESHPATRTFQALRMLVNDELGALAAFLRGLPLVLRPGGRAAILTFHSGEAKMVAQALKAGMMQGVYAAISEQGIAPSGAEIRDNPRSRSARLWWAESRV